MNENANAVKKRLEEKGFVCRYGEALCQNGTYIALKAQVKGMPLVVSWDIGAIDSMVKGIGVEEAVTKLEDELNSIGKNPPCNTDDILNYQQVKTKLCFQAIPVKENKELLTQVPHIILEDIAFVVRIDCDDFSGVINNTALKCYGISDEQLFSDAKDAARFTKSMKIQLLADQLAIILNAMGLENEDVIQDSIPIPLYVCRAGDIKGRYGAGVMIYPEFMRRALKKLGGAFYILPSSQNEVLLYPDTHVLDPKEMAEMVREINATQVPEEERLTDSVYYCDGKTIRKVA